MTAPWAPTRVFLARNAVDGRNGIDGLCQVVRDVFGDDPKRRRQEVARSRQAQFQGDAAEPALGRRHHVRADDLRVYLPRDRARRLEPPDRRVGDEHEPRDKGRAGRARHGDPRETALGGHPSLRPRLPVHVVRVRTSIHTSRIAGASTEADWEPSGGSSSARSPGFTSSADSAFGSSVEPTFMKAYSTWAAPSFVGGCSAVHYERRSKTTRWPRASSPSSSTSSSPGSRSRQTARPSSTCSRTSNAGTILTVGTPPSATSHPQSSKSPPP